MSFVQSDYNLSSPLSFVTLSYGLNRNKQGVVDKVVDMSDSMLNASYDRRIAFYAPKDISGYDRYISIRHKQSTDIACWLQDKNYHRGLSEAATNDILNDMNPALLALYPASAATFSVSCLYTTGAGVSSNVFRFTLDLNSDFLLLDQSTKDALCKLARPGAHSDTSGDEEAEYPGAYDLSKKDAVLEVSL